MEELGAEYLTMHHADLIETLHRLALSAGARVSFGAVVESVEPAPEAPPENVTSTSIAGPSSCTLRPSVRLKTGEILHADVIIGADGQRSIVRQVVTEEAEPEAISTGISVYTGSVSMSEFRKHAPLRKLAEGWLVWAGEGRVVLGYPVRRHQEFAFHVWWEDHNKSASASRQGALDSWDPTTSLSSIRYKEGKMDPRLRFLLDKAGAVSRQPYVEIPRLESWVDESESIVLIGEAAHPQGPGKTYACSLALEDAAILGTLFSRLRSRDQVPTLLYAFQDLHKARADAVTAMEIETAEVAFSNLPRVRDGLVRWSALPADEPDSRSESGPTDAELTDVMEVWGYFAIDAADEWWVEWGLLRERSHVRR
jgi:salicylate hydroxylase